MDILENKKVKTRKDHLCFACHRKFPKGTEMSRQVNVSYGEIYQVYWCETCDEILQNHSDYVYDEQEGCFPDSCVINIPVNYFSRVELMKKWTPEEILEKLNSSLESKEKQEVSK